MFAVIPTFVLIGPVALLAALFPAVFAGLAFFWRRWCVLLAVVSLNSTFYLLHAWFRGHTGGTWWSAPHALWTCLAVVSGVGVIVAWRRAKIAEHLPSKMVVAIMSLATLLALATMSHALYEGVLPRWPWRDSVAFLATLVAATGFAVRARIRGKASARAETGVLAGLSVGCVAVALLASPAVAPGILWTFEATERGLIFSTPAADDERIYVSVAHSSALAQFGAVYCLDRQTGKLIWSFDRARQMKQVLSSPTVHNGRVYVGEGLHEDAECGLYCLDAATGRELWRFGVGSHVESSPRVVGGCVYFGAGDDGVYCVDAVTSEQRWRFPGLHVDAAPAVVGDRLYAGSAGGGAELFCLDTATGRPVWRIPSDLTLFNAPAVADGHVYFGLGNGKLNRAADEPAGALLCVDAATGQNRWRIDVPDAVLGTPALAGDVVCFGCRDKHCYALACTDGARRWRQSIGSPVIAGPVLHGDRLYTVGAAGAVCSLDPRTGNVQWQFDVAAHLRTTCELSASPAILRSERGSPLICVGAGLHYSLGSAAVVCVVRGAGEER